MRDAREAFDKGLHCTLRLRPRIDTMARINTSRCGNTSLGRVLQRRIKTNGLKNTRLTSEHGTQQTQSMYDTYNNYYRSMYT